MDRETRQISEIIRSDQLSTVFQPIVDLRNRDFYGVEALTRGPQDTEFSSPGVLFPAAERVGLIRELELKALDIAGRSFARLAHNTRLFLNISPMSLMAPEALIIARDLLSLYQLDASRVVLELSEQYQTEDVGQLADALATFKELGFKVAVDDLGSGYAGLKTWSQLKPDYVKIDRHFISGIDEDPIKREFVRSILAMASEVRSRVIAEGIETFGEAQLIRELGVRYVQGFLFGKPSVDPAIKRSVHQLAARPVLRDRAMANRKTIGELATECPSIDVNTPLAQVMEQFKAYPVVTSLPILHHNSPVGLITRQTVLEIFSNRFGPELHARKPVVQFMNDRPIVVEASAALEDVSYLLTEDMGQELIQDFVVVERGCYRGIGRTVSLLRAITDQQISSARHANPLTLLPGNVPIDERITQLLLDKTGFWVAYCDINGFKAFNDVYGYAKGDKAIMLLANLVSDVVNSECDFVGHIGGDDFILLLQSEDTPQICDDICSGFAQQAATLYDPVARANKGIWAMDRRGEHSFFPLMTLAIGLVHPDLGKGLRSDDISSLASEAKKEAKLLPQGGVHLSPIRFPRRSEAA